jgi:hypothetical protein
MKYDRVAETSTTTGTGALNLDGAMSAYRGIVATLGDGNTERFLIINSATPTEWEISDCTVTDGTPDTLSRDTVKSSSNAGALVDFSAGTKIVTLVTDAEEYNDFPRKSEANTFSLAQTLSGGAYLGGTAANNLLDDHEKETTYTITLTPASGGSITLSGDTGLYTKIGGLVSVRGVAVVDSVSTSPAPSGQLQINLPLLVVGHNTPGIAQTHNVDFASAYMQVHVLAASGTTYALIQGMDDNASVATIQASTVSAGDQIRFQINYKTNA